MHLHILGISGTFMSALALLARDAGHKVTGSDANCYPPVSDLLAAKEITWVEGYDDTSLALQADLVVVGNAIKRGMPVLEAVIESGKPYTSGPQWLAENILSRYQVIAVSGTHGKTTTTSMVAWILHQAGLNPGFLIGGVSSDFQTSSCLGSGKWFVIEADEYDSAFFDKRPKFMHYRPRIAILNNLEFDHADIYSDLAAIQLQFHYLMRTIPASGVAIKPRDDKALNEVIARGQYSRIEELSLDGDAQWTAQLLEENGSAFKVLHHGKEVAEVRWPLIGRFNVENGLAALVASVNAGVNPKVAAEALERFTPVKRRLEVRSNKYGITLYDDFAHHPTAIMRTIDALKRSNRHQRIFAVLEFASYTMRTGVHAHEMAHALEPVHGAYVLEPNDFNLHETVSNWTCPYKICKSHDEIIKEVTGMVQAGDAVLVMSNRGFNGIHQKLINSIEERFSR
ncbi:UDP-N-acetylmuramate:L-alanyl-gamma-D-glutamyl-meso-diaminopimelate ligase [Legionella anisa]|uniref:UDP-N-acetylmuramate--L-alanyl-gamma-D-glutamyl-meso-2,6-diaminoheptandioate ligase n=1 Tax=Legionella anisa TaxID=28082 RepID=A0AAX0WV80_9GAMM|nr:UDP-N-acetylmuramate:L-alanyl-gamma-D-glutamyl-meso-diaminopimelate ligase [Legionella anisa]AWN74115.1 UDP-N-acetylmuramate:L-alanyl-gamma-D-glutamyl-meso-diaminopimelate ligase [Legionella anisa]KTC70012.1 UDP-N-acetylmuramate: L-alanyl-gamma-D-glutamyl-meso-diaminopimelate ligase [Legionella anisa]MBN5935138.1 UDP-N-acetylmuramate:L-alanyl-gamma-D-glutamyl-meso-diaminopimelate ligase [Legionella anisa]PNL61983.1 UDP-N-acetylmuramate:L-alanyl-gamma-D-glutamyl-meso-diaminopimelate ligase [L